MAKIPEKIAVFSNCDEVFSASILVSEAGRNTCAEWRRGHSDNVKFVNMFSTMVVDDFKDFGPFVFFAKVGIAPMYFDVCGDVEMNLQK